MRRSCDTLIQFESSIEVRGINPYIFVEAKLARRLKKEWRKPLPVLVRINDRPLNAWRINLMPAGDGNFYLYLHETVRKASDTKVGDRVRVQLAFDGAYRNGPIHPVPRSFRAALEANKQAKTAWEALSPSRKKEVLRYFASLKSTETKARNVKRAIEALLGSEVRFLARTWKNGR